jgi:hypothetical protein
VIICRLRVSAPWARTCFWRYETQGFAPQETMGAAAFAVDRPGLQVICRGGRGDYPAARDAAVSVRNLLAALLETTVSGVHILRVSADGGVLPMGEDQNGRPMVSANYSCQVLP